MPDNGPAGQGQDVTLAEQIAAVKRLIDFMWPDNPHSPNLAAMRAVLATLDDYTAMQTVAGAARRYRDAETDGTPRMWRGKALQDLANELDDAISDLASSDTALPAPQESENG